MNEKSCMSIRISLKFVSKSPIDNISALVWVMAWCRTGDKPLPEPMLTQFINSYMPEKMYSSSKLMEPAQHERNWQDLTHIIVILVEKYISKLKYYISSMAQCKTGVFPLLMHWRYWSLALSNQSTMYSQYIAVRLTIILYNMKYERKAITLFRQQSHKRHLISHS